MLKYYYDKYGNPVRYDCKKVFAIGGTSKIWKVNNDFCIKEFKDWYVCNPEVTKDIVRLNLENFIPIHTMLYDEKGNYVAFKMRYCQDEELDLLTMPVRYTLDNLARLYSSAIQLSQVGIGIYDLHEDNVILTRNGIYVIDYEGYSKSGFFTEKELLVKNRQMVNGLFRLLYDAALIKYHEEASLLIDYDAINRLFSYDDDYHSVSRKLVRYKRPIDYFRG